MSSEVNGRILGYVTGLLYFYGAVRFEDLYGIVQKTLQMDVPRDEFKSILDSNVQDDHSPYVFDREGDIYFDIEVEDVEWVLEEQAKRDEFYFRTVTEKEASCVVEDKYPLLWDEEEQQFFRWIQNLCGDDLIIASTLFLGYQAEIKNNAPPLELAKKVLADMNLSDLDDVRTVASRVMELYDHVPLWTLKGWRPVEVSA